MPESSDLTDELSRRATESAEGVDTARRGQSAAAASAAALTGTLAYYLGSSTDYFSSGPSLPEAPLYVSFLAVSIFAATELAQLCGRRGFKTLATSVGGGAVGGAGLGLSVAGLAFGLLGDILITGGAITVGGLAGGLLVRRGKKKHVCGARLNCDTWICPSCRHIINPSRHYDGKDQWTILDACEYLDFGGRGWDVTRALSFMAFTGLLDRGFIDAAGGPTLWDKAMVKARANDVEVVRDFNSHWAAFQNSNGGALSQVELRQIANLFDKWRRERRP